MITAFVLPATLRAQTEDAARAAFPRECCGLIEGRRDSDTIRATAFHPARNLSVEADRFEIDPADHFRALRIARANGHDIVGCYHSHPGGIAQPSERDRAQAVDENFLWLICAGSGDGLEIGASVFAHGEFHAVEILPAAGL